MRNFLVVFLTVFWFALTLQGQQQDFGLSHQDGHFSRPETGATATPLEKIIGHCTVIAGNGNIITQACSGVVLTLIPQDGGGTLYSRTSIDGTFEFNVPADKKYKIGVSSHLYEVVIPISGLHSGQEVNLQLRQK